MENSRLFQRCVCVRVRVSGLLTLRKNNERNMTCVALSESYLTFRLGVEGRMIFIGFRKLSEQT